MSGEVTDLARDGLGESLRSVNIAGLCPGDPASLHFGDAEPIHVYSSMADAAETPQELMEQSDAVFEGQVVAFTPGPVNEYTGAVMVNVVVDEDGWLRPPSGEVESDLVTREGGVEVARWTERVCDVPSGGRLLTGTRWDVEIGERVRVYVERATSSEVFATDGVGVFRMDGGRIVASDREDPLVRMLEDPLVRATDGDS